MFQHVYNWFELALNIMRKQTRKEKRLQTYILQSGSLRTDSDWSDDMGPNAVANIVIIRSWVSSYVWGNETTN